MCCTTKPKLCELSRKFGHARIANDEMLGEEVAQLRRFDEPWKGTDITTYSVLTAVIKYRYLINVVECCIAVCSMVANPRKIRTVPGWS
jgi:hypothetical protein